MKVMKEHFILDVIKWTFFKDLGDGKFLFTVIQTLFSKALTYLYKNTFSLEDASIFKFIHQACTHNPILYVMEEKVVGDFIQ